MSEQPRRILFSMLHSGYLRSYGSAIRLLAERGHVIHLALAKLEKDPGDVRLAEDLAAAYPENVTFGLAEQRSRRDPWRALAWLVRAFTDLARYMHPSYVRAPALRERVALKITNHVRSAKQIDPLTALLCLGFVRLFTRHSGLRSLRRALRVLQALETAIPTSRRIDRFVHAFEPDAVLVTPLIELGSGQVEYLKSAKRLGIRTGVCVASWDNLTGKGLIRIVPDRVFVWNDVQRREAVTMHGVPYERIVLTGAQRFDEWFERRPSTSRDEFTERVGLPGGRPYILYLCSSPFIAPHEVSFVTRWLERIRSGGESLREVGVLVRPHPQNAAQWREADLARFENVAIWPRAGAQPDAGDARAGFFDSLAHSAFVVGINTSALIESAIVGKRVYSVLADEFSRTQTGTLHFHYLLHENGGFLHVAPTLDEHVAQLECALSDDDKDEQTREFVASFVRPNGLDRPATPILAAAIEELAMLPRPRPERAPWSVWLLRACLGIVAVAAGALFAADRLARRGLYHPAAKAAGRWLLRRRAAAPVARRLDARAQRQSRPDLPPKPPHELRRIAVETSDEARALDEHLERIARNGGDVIVGPWRRTVEDELLYWIPFLRWAVDRFGFDPFRLTAVSRGGVASWYAGVCNRYRENDSDPPDAYHLQPELLDELVARHRTGVAPIRELLDRLRHDRVPAPTDESLEMLLPEEFVAVSFTGAAALPPDAEGLALIERTMTALGERLELVALDVDRADPFGLEDAGVLRPLVGTPPEQALHAQTVVTARAAAVVCEWGSHAHLGPLVGVRTVALHTDPAAAASPETDLAYRAARARATSLTLVDARAAPIVSALGAQLDRLPSY